MWLFGRSHDGDIAECLALNYDSGLVCHKSRRSPCSAYGVELRGRDKSNYFMNLCGYRGSCGHKTSAISYYCLTPFNAA
jgi:hypothetical protein